GYEAIHPSATKSRLFPPYKKSYLSRNAHYQYDFISTTDLAVEPVTSCELEKALTILFRMQ
ncbi:MAG: hypothetical protein ACRDCT_06430, partial [Shewanella sp.]